MAAGYRRAGAHAVCRRGCTACCVGPFDITALDAVRLARALGELRRAHPRVAADVAARAAAQWARLRPSFPGDPSTGVLAPDEVRREAFFARFEDLPCPALHPRTGACALYAARPISCRTFGLPVRIGPALLAPCGLNFATASPEVVAACVVEPDPGDREAALLATVHSAGRGRGDTIVANALALASGAAPDPD